MSTWKDMVALGVIAVGSIAAVRKLKIRRDEWQRRQPSAGWIFVNPPSDWSDREDWDRYFRAVLSARPKDDRWYSGLAYLELAMSKGVRVWFPGCGVSPSPYKYAERGCSVVATDFSEVAINYQRWRFAERFAEENEGSDLPGSLVVAEGDFTKERPAGQFDAVINCLAFQGLPFDAMRAAAVHFHDALRPGGVGVFETNNVGNEDHRARMEESLSDAGFYVPFLESDRWYRHQRERLRMTTSSPDPESLASLSAERRHRRKLESPAVRAMIDDDSTTVAHVIYGSG